MYISINTNSPIVTDETPTKLQKIKKQTKKNWVYMSYFNTRTITTNNKKNWKKPLICF